MATTCTERFVSNFDFKILSFEKEEMNEEFPTMPVKVAYRIRLTYKPTNKTMLITYENGLQAYEPVHVNIADLIYCLNADIAWWNEGGWTWCPGGIIDHSYASYKAFYTDLNNEQPTIKEYVKFKNQVITLKKVLEDDYDLFCAVCF